MRWWRTGRLARRSPRRACVATSSREALELADLRYRAGYSGYLEVLDSQRQLLLADTLRIIAARDARIALVDLSRSLGGGWSPDSVAVASPGVAPAQAGAQ